MDIGTPITNRKIRKPLMEKRRRARINQSVDQLQKLISENESTPKNMKMEKADILEMAVQYLKKMKQKTDMAKECEENYGNEIIESYRLGFEKCMEETVNLITSLPGIDSRLQDRINDHLKSCLDNVKNNSIRQSKKLGDENRYLSEICQNRVAVKNYPSKFTNSDFILIISPNMKENRSDVWRPWW